MNVVSNEGFAHNHKRESSEKNIIEENSRMLFRTRVKLCRKALCCFLVTACTENNFALVRRVREIPRNAD